MLERPGLALLGAAVLSFATSHALAQFPPVTDPTKDETKCQSSTGKALSGAVNALAKCATKCFRSQRKLEGPYDDCFSPYSGEILICVNDPLRGPEAKAAAAIVRACMNLGGRDRCPECYGETTCNTGEPMAGNATTLAEMTGESIYCTEFGGGTPSPFVAKCEDGVTKRLVKWVATINKCYDKCVKSERAGAIPPGSCDPPGNTYPPLQACLDKGRTKSSAGIHKVCFGPLAVAPSCYDGSPARPNTAEGWTDLGEGIVNTQVPLIACGSPSGAFLE
jgi:hypothetical protein